jgi:hypothetical protein
VKYETNCDLILLLFSSILLSARQAPTKVDPGIVTGTVMRAGTNEPLSDVVVSLEGAVSPETMQSLLSAAASAGIVISPPAGASLSETTQMMISTAAARGLPIQAPGIQNLVTRTVGIQTWPMVTTDPDGRFAFRDIRPGRYTVRAVREGFFGKPVNGTYPPTAWSDVVVAEKDTKQVSLALVPGATIEGRVSDTAGAPLPNATIQMYSLRTRPASCCCSQPLREPPRRQTHGVSIHCSGFLQETIFWVRLRPCVRVALGHRSSRVEEPSIRAKRS